MLTYAKAITAAGIAGLSALTVALPDGVTTPELVAVLLAALLAAGTVWRVPNAPAPPAAGFVDYPEQDDPA